MERWTCLLSCGLLSGAWEIFHSIDSFIQFSLQCIWKTQTVVVGETRHPLCGNFDFEHLLKNIPTLIEAKILFRMLNVAQEQTTKSYSGRTQYLSFSAYWECKLASMWCTFVQVEKAAFLTSPIISSEEENFIDYFQIGPVISLVSKKMFSLKKCIHLFYCPVYLFPEPWILLVHKPAKRFLVTNRNSTRRETVHDSHPEVPGWGPFGFDSVANLPLQAWMDVRRNNNSSITTVS